MRLRVPEGEAVIYIPGEILITNSILPVSGLNYSCQADFSRYLVDLLSAKNQLTGALTTNQWQIDEIALSDNLIVLHCNGSKLTFSGLSEDILELKKLLKK